MRRTKKYGKRLLTQQSRETNKLAGDQRSSLQYGWIKYRIVCADELSECLQRHDVNLKQTEEIAALLEARNLIHCVVSNLYDEAWIITNYFWESHAADVRETLQSTVLDLLEHDDPSIISDAAANPIFARALMQHFQSGDQREPRLWHTLSKLKAPLNLLSYCVQQNYSECIDLLLSGHSMQTARKPWLTFAEPTLAVDKYQNTAFHIAAWCGSAESLELLVQHASRHSYSLKELLDSKKKTCLTLARERGNNRCVDILAPLFGHHVKEGNLSDRTCPEVGARLFLDFDDAEVQRDQKSASQTIALAPPQDLLAWIDFDGLSWLVREDVKSRTYAEDDVWIPISQGNEIVRVESMMRDCIWDVSMAAESLPERVLASDYGYLRIQVAPRRRARLSTEAASSALLEVIQTILERVPHGKQVKNLTLIGLTLLQDSEEAEIWCSMFQLLSRCKTISFRKCLCQPMTLLYILRAVRHVLELGEYEWSNLYVIPSCAVSISDESAAGFRAEMPVFLNALRSSKLLHISRSGCKQCKLPFAHMQEPDRFWVTLVASSLDLNRFGHQEDNPRADGVPTFFLHGLVDIWRFLYSPARVVETKALSMDDALQPAAAVYVREWLKNITHRLAVSSDSDLREMQELMGLRETELQDLLKQMDFAVWALLRMHRLMPFVIDCVKSHLPRYLQTKMCKSDAYLRDLESQVPDV